LDDDPPGQFFFLPRCSQFSGPRDSELFFFGGGGDKIKIDVGAVGQGH
jgi:hypothetical protein